MNTRASMHSGCKILIAVAFGLALMVTPAIAKNSRGVVTLIEMGDLHGTLVPQLAQER